jgi:uncharacterized protein (TIGR03545 family)
MDPKKINKKTKLFRIKAIIPIFIVIILMGIFTIFFLDNIIKNILIHTGEKTFQAKVEIQNSDLSLKPFGITLSGIKIANKENPFENIFEASKIETKIQLKQLLKKKLIIEEIHAQNLSFNSPRKTSGKLKSTPKKPKKEKKKNNIREQEKEEKKDKPKSKFNPLNKVNEIAANTELNDISNLDNLETVKQSNALKAEITQLQEKWDKILKNQTYEQKFNKIAKEAEDVLNINIKGFEDIPKVEKAVKQADQIKRKTDTLIKEINIQKKELEKDYKNISQKIESLSKVGKADYNNISSTINPANLNSENLTALLLDKQLKSKLDKAIKYYKLYKKYKPKKGKKPKKSKRKGSTIAFPNTKKPIPSLWIKSIRISGKGLSQESLNGNITNISSNQDITGVPTLANLTGKNVFNPGTTSKGNAKLDTSKDNQIIEFNGNIQNYPLENINIYEAEDKKIIVKQAKLDFTTDTTIDNGELNGKITILASNLTFQNNGIDTGKLNFESVLAQVLNKTQNTVINCNLSGAVTHPDIQISSDIDQKLKTALNEIKEQEIKKAKAKVKKQIDQIVAQNKSELAKQLGLSENQFEGFFKDQLSFAQNAEKLVNKEKAKLEEQGKKIQNQIQNSFKNLF